jgi:hypothetical protein
MIAAIKELCNINGSSHMKISSHDIMGVTALPTEIQKTTDIISRLRDTF